MTTLVYIGGYGRSGSTLLESLLTTRSDVLACGEIVCCLRKRVERRCTCGRPRQDCVVWSPFYPTAAPLHGLTHEALTLSLLDRASDRYSLLVDSSKTAWGALSAPFKLRRKLDRAFHLVHIVRDPRGVCWSNAGGAWKRHAAIRSPALRHLRTSLGWWAANLSCALFGELYPDQYTEVRYEDLAQSHPETLARIFADLPTEEAAPHVEERPVDNRHQLYGNQSRYNEFSPSDIREDIRWRTEMPAAQRNLVAALTWPLRVRYGY